jgi:hypothetical protein
MREVGGVKALDGDTMDGAWKWKIQEYTLQKNV